MEKLSKNKKVIVILGPTASGKTSLAVKLAQKYNGEIVSADSRQVYRGMDIGTGKDLSEFSFKGENGRIVNIPHHLIDVCDPMERFDIVRWNKEVGVAIDDILKRGKVPIVVGGTGMYIQSLVDNYDFSKVRENKKEREILEKKDKNDLLGVLKKIKPEIIDELDNNDLGNKRRLIRYIEILREDKGFSVKKSVKKDSKYDFLLLGLFTNREDINKKIQKRLLDRVEKEGMIEEIKNLHEGGVSWKRLEEFGLEYKHISWYLNDRMEYDDMLEKLNIAIRQFAKRQMTWFKRWEKQGAKINWVSNINDSSRLIDDFLNLD